MVQYLGIGPGFEAVMVVTGLEGERSNWLWGRGARPIVSPAVLDRKAKQLEKFPPSPLRLRRSLLTNRLDAVGPVGNAAAFGGKNVSEKNARTLCL